MKKLAIVVVVLGSLLAGCIAVPVSDGRGFSRDRDRDGVPNRYDRDRDVDGGRNSQDRAPNNPNRY